MWWAHLLWLPICLSLHSLNEPDPLEPKLRQYLQLQKQKTGLEYNTCNIFIKSNSETAFRTADLFIKVSACPVVIMRSNFRASEVTNPGQFYFLDTLEELIPFFEHLQTSPSWQRNKPSHVFICSPTTLDAVVTGFFDYLWDKRVYPVVVVTLGQPLRVLSHDPFLRRLEDLVDCDACRFPSTYMANLRGYPLRIGFYEYPPTLSKVHGNWVGIDYSTLRDISERLRAKPAYIDGSRGDIMDGLFNNSIDIVGSSRFVYNHSLTLDKTGCDFIYIAREEIVALLPMSKQLPVLETVIQIAESGTFTFVLALLVIFALAIRALSFLHGLETNLVDCILLCWQILLSSSISLKLTSQPTLIQLLLLAWISFSVVFNTIFLLTLWNIIFNPAYETEIDTFAELEATGLRIYGNKNCVDAIRREYGHWAQLREVDPKLLDAMLRNRTIDVAYVMRRSAAKEYLRLGETQPVYSIMEETVLPGILAYMIPRDSPFQASFKMSMLYRKEYMSNEVVKASFGFETGIIDLEVLQSIFLLLSAGYVIAFIVFLVEMFIGKRQGVYLHK